MRVPSRTRCCCTADSASSAGIATCVGVDAAVADRISTLWPSSIASSAARAQPRDRGGEPVLAVGDRVHASTA